MYKIFQEYHISRGFLADNFSMGVNKKFQRVNSHCCPQTIKNLLLICQVIDFFFLTETPPLSVSVQGELNNNYYLPF